MPDALIAAESARRKISLTESEHAAYVVCAFVAGAA